MPFLNDSHSDWVEMGSQSRFDFCFPDGWRHRTRVKALLWAISASSENCLFISLVYLTGRFVCVCVVFFWCLMFVLLYILYFLCMHMCSVCTCVWVHRCPCLCMWRPEEVVSLLLSCSSPYVLRQSPSLNLTLIIWLDCG